MPSSRPNPLRDLFSHSSPAAATTTTPSAADTNHLTVPAPSPTPCTPTSDLPTISYPPHTIPLYNGFNYAPWRRQLTLVLLHYGLYELVTSDKAFGPIEARLNPLSMEYLELRRKKELAVGIMLSSVDVVALEKEGWFRMRDVDRWIETPRKLWEAVGGEEEDSDEEDVGRLRARSLGLGRGRGRGRGRTRE